MWGTSDFVNFFWLFSTLVIGQNFKHQKKPFKMEFKHILSRKRFFCRVLHSLCENENIPM